MKAEKPEVNNECATYCRKIFNNNNNELPKLD